MKNKKIDRTKEKVCCSVHQSVDKKWIKNGFVAILESRFAEMCPYISYHLLLGDNYLDPLSVKLIQMICKFSL